MVTCGCAQLQTTLTVWLQRCPSITLYLNGLVLLLIVILVSVPQSARCIWLCHVQDVVITSSGSGALDMAISVFSNPGQNIVVPKPGFAIYRCLAGAKSVETRFYRLLVRLQHSVSISLSVSLSISLSLSPSPSAWEALGNWFWGHGAVDWWQNCRNYHQ